MFANPLRRFAGGLIAFALLAAAPGALAAPQRPNVVIIVADDLGWADVGYHGGPIATPTLDRLAAEGLQLDHFYTAPHCTPTRAMLMTGRDPMRMGIAYEQVNPWNNAGVPPDEHFMAESFRAAGYQTAMVGKWHMGHTQGQYHPNGRGFDDYYGHLNTAIDYWTHSRRKGHDWQRNGKSVDERGRYATDLQGEGGARAIRERDPERPFFLYVAFNAPHNPMQAPDALVEKYAHLPEKSDAPGYLAAIAPVPECLRPRFERFRRVYAAMVDSMDQAVANILGALDEQGIAQDTLVLFMSDNGGFNVFGADNTPLRGQKAQTFEGGIRVPALMRWPGKLGAGQRRGQLISAMDVFPTLAAATGVALRNEKPLDGVNLWPQLESGGAVAREGELFYVSEVPIPGQVFFAVRSGPWKLVQVERIMGLSTVTHLFRVADDPNEERDLSAAHPDIVARLEARLADWKKLHPPRGLRRDPAPHPAWRPPLDWAAAMLPADSLQAETRSDFINEGNSDPDAGRVFLYRPPSER